MTRRIVRTVIQLTAVLSLVLLAVLFLDSRYRVLPPSIHNYLPTHNPGLVVTDVTVTTCSTVNVFSSCKLDPNTWHRIDRELYLGSSWVSSAYVHVQRKREEDLQPGDKVVVDITIGRLDPTVSISGETEERWEARPAGIWLKRSSYHHSNDLKKAVTAVDVLFGADAVDPRTGWQIKDTALLLSRSGDAAEPRLSIRRGSPSVPTKPTPRIRSDGKFKIMQVSDMHLSTGLGVCRDAMPPDHNGGKCDADPRTLEFVGRLLDEEKPDFVVLSGDQVNGDTAPDAQTAILKYAELFIRRQIPYASIFGNHDDERTLSREAQMSLIESLPYSLSEAGPEEIDGVGNYVIEILARGNSKHSALTLYLLDSHSYSPDERSFQGYDWIKKNQIDWFKKTADDRKRAHAEYAHVHMDLAFIHIPLPEYRESSNVFKGQWKEGVTAPGFNSGFRDALVDENILLVSCGHDHVNEYCMLSTDAEKEPKLWMCYAGGSGFGGYGGYGGYHRRVRFFDIDMGASRISTYKRVEYGDDINKKIDEQIIVDSGRVIRGNA